MRRRGEKLVERPWIGMTVEPLTDVEQAWVDLAADVDALKARMNVPARLRGVGRHVRADARTASGRWRAVAVFCAAFAVVAAVTALAVGRAWHLQ